MNSPWTVRGLFRIKNDPNTVQVQFGPFSRPLTEREYLLRGLEPQVQKLPWKSEHNAHCLRGAQLGSSH